MKYYFPFLILTLAGLLPSNSVRAQAGLLPGKQVGLYLSSRAFEFEDDLNLEVSQFLKLGEDRSYAGNMKSELLIQLGWMLSEQLQRISRADTVIFLNADVEKGLALKGAYDSRRHQLLSSRGLEALDVVLVLDTCVLSDRIYKSVYIRSNRMYTDRIPVMYAKMQMTLLDTRALSLALSTEVCFDEKKDAKTPHYFDFYERESDFGDFLTGLFSRWWQQMEDGESGSCK